MKTTNMNTGICRASYLNAITPRVAPGSQDAKYSVQLLIPKTDTETVRKIKECIANALANDREGKNHLKGINNPKNPLHDGDGEKPNGGAYDEVCKGHWVMNATSKSKPGLVDINNDILADPAEWYSGIYVRAAINFYAYNSAGNKGIACGLNHLQKRRDGDPLSGAGNPAAAFKDDYQDDDDILG
jgi:hypothetical protein